MTTRSRGRSAAPTAMRRSTRTRRSRRPSSTSRTARPSTGRTSSSARSASRPSSTRAATAGATGSSFVFPTTRTRSSAVFQKNLHLALNLPTRRRTRTARRTTRRTRPSTRSSRRWTSSRRSSTSPTAAPSRRGDRAPLARPRRHHATISGPGGTSRSQLLRATAVPRRRALRRRARQVLRARPRDAAGELEHGRRAARPAAGDVVAVTSAPAACSSASPTAIASTQADKTKKRVLVVAAEDYTGTSPNRKPGYATAPRYLQQHVDALRPPATRSTRSTPTRRR